MQFLLDDVGNIGIPESLNPSHAVLEFSPLPNFQTADQWITWSANGNRHCSDSLRTGWPGRHSGRSVYTFAEPKGAPKKNKNACITLYNMAVGSEENSWNSTTLTCWVLEMALILIPADVLDMTPNSELGTVCPKPTKQEYTHVWCCWFLDMIPNPYLQDRIAYICGLHRTPVKGSINRLLTYYHKHQ